MKKIVVATRNKGKIREIEAVLNGLPFQVLSLDEFPPVPDAVEDGATFEENAAIKALYYHKHTGYPCLADDSGLEVDALGGEPGVYSARYAGEECDDAANNAKVLEKLGDTPAEKRTGRFRCVLAFADEGKTLLTAEGSCEGIILRGPKGDGGFGYDPLFYVPDLKTTLADIPMEEKNKISHRGKALRNLVEKLRGLAG